MGGAVYGCEMDTSFRIVHNRAVTQEERDHFKKSKYTQSRIGNIYEKLRSDLKSGIYVLFSGTSCQTAAIRNYVHLLRLPTQRLYCIDILCRGVPSQKLWDKYLSYIEKRYKGSIEYIEYRDKSYKGWRSHYESFVINGQKHYSNDFGSLFIKDVYFRPSCYNCKYKTVMHPSDITLGDFWEVDEAIPGFNDNKGISLVLINSVKGYRLFEQCKDNLIVKQAEFKKSEQDIFYKPVKKPKSRPLYWIILNALGINVVLSWLHFKSKFGLWKKSIIMRLFDKRHTNGSISR